MFSLTIIENKYTILTVIYPIGFHWTLNKIID